MAEATLHAAELPAARPWYRRRLWVWPLLLLGLLVVYYLGGMLWVHEIDDDPEFALESSAPEGGSRAVEVADNLLGTLDRFAADIGSQSAAIERKLADRSAFWPDWTADDLFYANKGRLYAYYLLLRELQADFANVIRERELVGAWTQTLESFREAATLQPMVIMNGAPDAQLMPSHLASQGFFLLRARTQLREISNILLK